MQIRSFFLRLLKFVVWRDKRSESIDFILKIRSLQFNEFNPLPVSNITSYKFLHQISSLPLHLTVSKIIPLKSFNHVHFHWTGEVQQPSQADPLRVTGNSSGDAMGLEDLSTPHPCLRLDSFQHASQWPVPFCSKIGSPRRGRQPLGAWNDPTERRTCRSKAGSDLTRARSPSNQGHGLADLSTPAKWACTTFHQPQDATSGPRAHRGELIPLQEAPALQRVRGGSFCMGIPLRHQLSV